MRNQLLAALMVSALGLGAVSAMAQMGPGRKGGDDCPMAEQMQERRADRQEMLELRLLKLEKDLKLTDKQQPAWEAASKAMLGMMGDRPDPKDMQALRDKPMPERMNAHVKQMEQRLQSLRETQKLVADLYAQLTPEQQKLVDDFHPMGMGGKGMMGKGRHGMEPKQ